jgi:Cu2+-exporting ATPase
MGSPLEAKLGRSTEGAYCSTGCREVADALGAFDGLVPADMREAAAAEADRDLEDDVPPGRERSFLRVIAMYCTRWEAFLETVAEGTGGVERARASYATDTVRVDYDPDTVDPASLPDTLSRAGYTAMERDDSLAKQRAEDEAETVRRLGRDRQVTMVGPIYQPL